MVDFRDEENRTVDGYAGKKAFDVSVLLGAKSAAAWAYLARRIMMVRVES